MTKLTTHAFIAAGLLVLTGCEQTGAPVPEARAAVSNASFNVERLFRVDGCNVYRFRDSGYPRYLTTCTGRIEHTESCGKSCTRRVEIETAGGR